VIAGFRCIPLGFFYVIRLAESSFSAFYVTSLLDCEPCHSLRERNGVCLSAVFLDSDEEAGLAN
jgi:hypothetical protein